MAQHNLLNASGILALGRGKAVSHDEVNHDQNKNESNPAVCEPALPLFPTAGAGFARANEYAVPLFVVPITATAEWPEVATLFVALHATIGSVLNTRIVVKARVHLCAGNNRLRAEWIPRHFIEH